ncbi:MAG TPA: peptidyl-tRNA hydrolase [Corynebacterium sp.]|nr:peptidyl-tRNA hydrolase [Corynebacterium sp.]
MSPEFNTAHQRLVDACTGRSWRDIDEDPQHPETVQAMQLALNMPKSQPPSRIEILESAARAVVAVCLDERAGQDGEFAEALGQWYGHRIRKVARRARNKAWDDVQDLPGVTINNQARAFIPSAVQDVPAPIAKLQIGHTDLPREEVGAPLANAPVIYVDSSLEMTAGKAAAQVGHGSMLYAASLSTQEAWQWQETGFLLSVREVSRELFEKALAQPGAVVIRDAGYTEVAPDSATVVALSAPIMLESVD